MALQGELQVPSQQRSPTKTREAFSKSTSVRLLDHAQIAQFETEWSRLSDHAIVPNPFYEPWNILPAIEHLKGANDIRFLLVFGPAAKDGTEPLWGFFPLELQPKCLHLPIRTFAFWQHRYCFLTTPLVDASHVWEALDSFWRWFESNPVGRCILDTNWLSADGLFREVWTEFAIGRAAFTLLDFPRAFLKPNETPELYLARSVSKNGRDLLARKKRRLEKIGKVEYRESEGASDVDHLLDDFLKLEASGWKGKTDGGAFAKYEQDTDYLKRMVDEGFRRHRISVVSLVLDGKPIAMRLNLLSGPGSFSFKIAYDENYAKYSPGQLLEVEYLRSVFESTRTMWVDSCTTPRHPLHNRLWSDRLMIRRTLISNGSRAGDFWISLIPFLRFWKNWFRPSDLPPYLSVSTKRRAVQSLDQHGG
jgi:hypothetical protein